MDEAKLQEIDERRARVLRDGTAAGALCMAADDVPDLVAEVRRLTAALATVTTEHAAALAAARREGRTDALRECLDIASSCAQERRNMLARWDAEGVRGDDERRAWVYCKASEAERIRDTIRTLPLDAPGGGS